MIRHIHSNRLEILAELLCTQLTEIERDPFQPIEIIVQSRGMERWLSLRIAEKLGICSNIIFTFPASWLRKQVSPSYPLLHSLLNINREELLWKLLRLLPSQLQQENFSVVNNYLLGQSDTKKAFRFCHEIADLFHRYTLFRHQLIADWLKEESIPSGFEWQASFFSELLVTAKHESPGLRAEMEFLSSKPTDNNLPIFIFGISSLPPFYLTLLDSLSKSMDIDLILLNPSQEFWGDLPDASRRFHYLKRGFHLEQPAELLHLNAGNDLVASLGTAGKKFLDQLLDISEDFNGIFLPVDDDSLLAKLQNDILTLQGPPSDNQQQYLIQPPDDSIQINICHTAMREIEVLYDTILDSFQHSKDLTPSDILVMTPDIELYSPCIQAVFGNRETNIPHIPFSIADNPSRKENSIAEGLLLLLQLPQLRFTVSEILQLLELPAVHKKFNISIEDLDTIREWLHETGIRWGINDQHRQELDLPCLSTNTWQAGIEQLLLGLAMPDDFSESFSGIIPFTSLESSQYSLLSKLLDYLDKLFTLNKEWQTSCSLSLWADRLQSALDLFFLPTADEAIQVTGATKILRSLREKDKINDQMAVNLDIILDWLKQSFDEANPIRGFLSSGITFCAMVPMRCIPAKIIYLVGMNDGAFPREELHSGFDLMKQFPKPSDKNRREDDRYLFLEAILSARKKLIISYIGRNVRDQRIIPPSTVVSELLDFLDDNYSTNEQNISEKLQIVHRLHPFHPDYFTPSSKHYSYSGRFKRIANLLRSTNKQERVTFPEKLVSSNEELVEIELQSLLSFFKNPTKFILKKQLGISYYSPESRDEDNEPFIYNTLENYQLDQELLSGFSSGQDSKKLYEKKTLTGKLPHKTQGQRLFFTHHNKAKIFYQQLFGDVTLREDFHDINLQIGNFKISGRIPLINEYFHQFRIASLKGKDFISIWIQHLLLCCTGHNKQSRLTGTNSKGASPIQTMVFAIPDDAEELLLELLNFFHQGCRQPLPFYPNISYEYFTKNQKNSSEQAMIEMQRKWENQGDYGFTETKDPTAIQVWGLAGPFSEEFCQVTEAIFQPLKAHCEEEK